jgi:hypothetical protein
MIIVNIAYHFVTQKQRRLIDIYQTKIVQMKKEINKKYYCDLDSSINTIQQWQKCVREWSYISSNEAEEYCIRAIDAQERYGEEK